MGNVWAIKTGNWNDATLWSTGTVPTSSDDVWASGSTVLINQDVTVQSLNNFASGAIPAGGTFNCYTSRTISASLFRGGTTTLLTTTGSGITINLVGTISGSTTTLTNTINTLNTFTNSTLNITGDFLGAAGYPLTFAASGSTLNIKGNLYSSGQPVNITSVNSTINISGSMTPGAGGSVFNAAGTSNVYNLTGSLLTGGAGSVLRFSDLNSVFNMIGNVSSLNTTTNGYSFSVGSISSLIRIIGNITGSVGQNSTMGLGGSYNTIIITGSVLGFGGGTSAAILPGGYNNNLIISGNVSTGAAGSYCIRYNNIGSPTTCSIIGNVTSPNSYQTITFQGTTGPSLMNIIGNLYGGAQVALDIQAGAYNVILNVSGNVYGGNNTQGISCGSPNNIVNITGNVYGGTGSNGYGIYNNNTGTVNILGSAVGGASVGSYGAVNNSTGVLRTSGVVSSVSASGLYGVSPYGVTTFESMTFTPSGPVPLVGYCEMVVGRNSFASCSLLGGGYKMLVDSNNIVNGQPTASDVRAGTVYNFGSNIGTMAVPSTTYVALGTPVDNTTGSALITTASISSAVWNNSITSVTVSGSMGDVAENISTVDSIGDQLTALL